MRRRISVCCCSLHARLTPPAHTLLSGEAVAAAKHHTDTCRLTPPHTLTPTAQAGLNAPQLSELSGVCALRGVQLVTVRRTQLVRTSAPSPIPAAPGQYAGVSPRCLWLREGFERRRMGQERPNCRDEKGGVTGRRLGGVAGE